MDRRVGRARAGEEFPLSVGVAWGRGRGWGGGVGGGSVVVVMMGAAATTPHGMDYIYIQARQ